MRKKTKMKYKPEGTYFKVHTTNLLKEIFCNDKMGIFKIPINRLGFLLGEVGERCAEINDPILNQLMVDLAIYEEATLDSKDYDEKMVKKVRENYKKFYENTTTIS